MRTELGGDTGPWTGQSLTECITFRNVRQTIWFAVEKYVEPLLVVIQNNTMHYDGLMQINVIVCKLAPSDVEFVQVNE